MALGENTYTAKDGALFWQSDITAAPEYMGSYDLDEIDEDLGGIELIQDRDANGRFRTRGFTEDAPSVIETTLTTYLTEAAELLEGLDCPGWLHINMKCGGRSDVMANYERGFILDVAKVTNRKIDNLSNRSESDAAEQMFDIAALPPVTRIFALSVLRKGLSETRAVNDVFLLKDDRCSDCSVGFDAGTYGLQTTDGFTAISANILFTVNGGVTWTAGSADPFAVVENVQPGVAFMVGKDTVRFLVGRGTTDAGAPAEVAYTDFNLVTDTAPGASWTLVNLGSTNALFFNRAKTIYVHDLNNIWAVTTGGYIFKSTNGGGSWTVQDAGVATVENLNAVQFAPGSKSIGYAAGANNAVLKTIDGGVTWSALTGPSGQTTDAVLALAVLNKNVVMLGYDDGTLWRTANGGLTWTQITGWTGTGVGDIQSLSFVNELVGFMAHNNASPVGAVLFTRDGGNTWEAKSTPTNTGLNAIDALNAYTAFAAGEVQAATAVLLKASK